jgi:PAS domain S-box-containing protein
MKKFHIDVGIRITLLYLLFGGLWILFSDRFLDAVIHNTEDLTRFQSYKGWAFVAASALLIYYLLRQYLNIQKKIKKQLHESEERLRLAVSASNLGIYDLNLKTDEIIGNDVYARMLGYESDSYSEKFSNGMKRIHPDDQESFQNQTKEYISGNSREYIVEFRQKDQAGDWRWIHATGQIVERDSHDQPVRILGTFSDFTDAKNAEITRIKLFEESQRRLKRIASLREIDQEISSSSDLSATLKKIVINVQNHLEADAVDILLFDESQSIFLYAESIGFDTKRIMNARVKMGGSFAGIAAQEREMVHFNVLSEGTVDEAFSSLLKEENISNYFGMPLVVKDKLVGVLEVYLRREEDPDQEWLDFYKTLAGQAALAIENARLVDGLESAYQGLTKVNADLLVSNSNLTAAYDATIESLALALNLRDYETVDHSRRVTTMMMELANMMDFSPEELVNIHRGTLLHDIGKLGVPDAILRKPGILTTEERQIMQQHPVFAYNLLKSIEYLQPALDIPHLHHEKWDGTGYPYGLAGKNIPLSARLFAIVDVYDALTSDRPYRKAWTRDATIEFIKGQKAIHFDPKVVDLFLLYLSEHNDI